MFIENNRNSEESDGSYEFCPRCDANLTLQKGYSNDLPFWNCLGCGEMLINPNVETDSDIAWICDGCGKMMNIQPGFKEGCGEWKCVECGHINKIDPDYLYASEDEYQADLKDPYKGLSDKEVLELSLYQEEVQIGDREDVVIVRNNEDGNRYVKKLLTIYDKSVYEYLKDHPVDHMPQICALYESNNCLIVIEEYIEGQTLADIIDKELLSESRAVEIARSVCIILRDLQNLPTPVIHRDIKPANIILSKAGQVYLLDMNAAKWYDPDETDDTRYMGTTNYAAPEQAGFGLLASSGKTDVYGVGMLLNVMLTGDFPKNKRASGRIWDVIEKCISLDPEDRYTVSELIETLNGFQG
ncbi:MAG: protein kinase [Lachnospiraceae bacterium]|nr:protein kinase [Lachnospiraceae bacterium]